MDRPRSTPEMDAQIHADWTRWTADAEYGFAQFLEEAVERLKKGEPLGTAVQALFTIYYAGFRDGHTYAIIDRSPPTPEDIAAGQKFAREYGFLTGLDDDDE